MIIFLFISYLGGGNSFDLFEPASHVDTKGKLAILRGVARILTIGGQDRKIAREAREKFLNTGHTH